MRPSTHAPAAGRWGRCGEEVSKRVGRGRGLKRSD